MPGRAQLWARAVRPFSFTASVIPVLVGGFAGWAAGGTVAWPLLAPVVIAAVAVHAGTNLFNDTHDYRRGVDREGTLGGSGLLVEGQLSPSQTNVAALLCFALAAALGIWFVALRGWPVAIVGMIGLVGGYTYTGRPVGYKYIALGDPLVFVLMGPLMVVGADLVLTGVFHQTTLWISLPIGFLVMSILHGNNIRDLDDDRDSGFRTIAMLLGPRAARAWYLLMVLAAFATCAALIAAEVLPLWSALVLLALPAAVKNGLRVLRQASSGDELSDIDVQSAQVHAMFGVLLGVSLVVANLV
jgi:1,4-dihydroxy-2-naphthoate octaprenyltransferase